MELALAGDIVLIRTNIQELKLGLQDLTQKSKVWQNKNKLKLRSIKIASSEKA